jgi:hypothetical protein
LVGVFVIDGVKVAVLVGVAVFIGVDVRVAVKVGVMVGVAVGRCEQEPVTLRVTEDRIEVR